MNGIPKLRMVALLALMTIAASAMFATTAHATPSKTTQCNGCHDGVNVPVTTTLVSATASLSTYSVSAPGANAIAVFDGATKKATIQAASGQFAVAPGKTYTVFSVKGPTTSSGLGTTSVSPVAPVDTTAPVTTSNAVATYVSSAAITLSATDAGGSGVAATYYRLDGAAQVTGTSVTVSTLGAHTLEFWSVDVKGNLETHKTASFTITAPDTTAPLTTSNAVATYVSSAAITLSATDAGGTGVAATYYRLDGGVQMTGTTVSLSTLGAHTLQFWSVDRAGNVELYKTAAFTIAAPDTTAPVTTSNAVSTYVSSAAITLSATDAGGSGVAATYYRLDGGAQVAGTSVTVSTVGAHSLEFWSVDVKGNVETHKTASFTINAPVPVDTTAPVTTSNAIATYVSSAAITLSATDAGGSGVAATYYRLDGGAQVAGTSVTVSTLGAHSLEFWSVDVKGNVETHKTASFTINAPVPVDTTAPVTTSNAIATYVSRAVITLSAADGGSAIAGTYYKLDGGAQVTGTSITVTALGAHTLEFWSADSAGNVETHKTASFTVTAPPDLTAPVTTSNAAATYVTSAAIALSATDAGGSGVAATYYMLDGGTQVSGTSVTVSTLGAHTLEFWSVDGAGNAEVHKTASFTISNPAADTIAPTTKSDAKPSYNKTATIHLTGSDNAGGSGVAHTYYIIDSGTQAEGTTINVTSSGAHMLEFWSVDVAGNVESHKTVSFKVGKRVHRLYNSINGSHFYTADDDERDSVLSEQKSVYTLDGVAFEIDPSNPDNSAPLHRFFNKEHGSHFYTASESEKARVIAELDDEYSYDGPAFNVSKTPVAGAVTVWRFYNKSNGTHFYTSDTAEKASVQANLGATYQLDGPAYYLAP